MLSYKLSKLVRFKTLVNITQATSIGLVYKVEDEAMFNTVKLLIKEITTEKRQVMALGFVDDYSIPDFCVAAYSGYYFNKKALNWLYAPKSDYILTFINKEYDILIDLSTSGDYVLKYIVALSRAKLKVGRQRKGFEKYYDLMIRMKKKDSLKDFADQAIHYLTVLKSK